MDTTGNIVTFKGREGSEKAAEEISQSAEKIIGSVVSLDKDLDLESNLPELKEDDEVVTTMEASEIAMLKQTIILSKRIKEDLKLYETQIETNLRKLLDKPDMISAYLIKKALYDEVENTVVVRLSKNKSLVNLLKKTMFWRIQERIDLFDYNLTIRKGFKVVKTTPVEIKDLEDAGEMLKQMQMMHELETSNHPMARMLREILKDKDN